ncbi:hypothetical protein Aperf_G00000025823 [Anoplocephala perfoliata]
METFQGKSLFISNNLDRVLHQPWMRDKKRVVLALLVGSTSLAFGGMAYPYVRNVLPSPLFGHDKDLPIGLPNNSNLCYLNALLQAMASCHFLVRSFRRSLTLRRSRLLFSLVTVLEGLNCSSKYLRNNGILDSVLLARKMLVEELARSGKLTVGDQQDVHELYSFFIDMAECGDKCRAVEETSEAVHAFLSTVSAVDSSLLLEKKLQRLACFTPCLSFSSAADFTHQTSPTVSSFCQLCANQIFCSKCHYKGQLKILPESSIILFPDKSRRLHTRNRSAKTKAAYKFTIDGLLKDEFGTAEHLAGIHCPRCKAKATYVPENILNDPTPTVVDRSAVRHFAESACRNTCYSHRWFALSSDTAQKMSQLSVAPPLVFYVQRAVWLPLKYIDPSDENFVYHFSEGGMMIKCTDHVDFSEVVDVSSYLAGGCTFKAIANRIKCNAKYPLNGNETSNNYVLRAVIVHRGYTLQEGHYVAYRRWRNEEEVDEGATSESWIITSDGSVNRVDFSAVKKCQAYMLFYEPVRDVTEEATPDCQTGITTEDGCDGERHEQLIRNIEKIASPAERIRILMAAACGASDVD